VPSTNFGEDPSAGIFEKILSCETADAVGETLLEPMVDALGATSGVFMQIFSSPYGDRHFGARSYVGSKPASVDAYVDGLYALDPVIRPVMDWLDDERGPAPSLLTGSFERNLEEDPQYRDTFLRPYDIGHVVAVAMPMRTGLETQLACVGFHRRHGDIAFLPEQLSWFQRLVPAIRSVLYALACKEALALSETIAIAAREAGTEMGFLILDEDLVVRNGNAKGMEDLGLTGGAQGGSSVLGEIKARLLAADRAPGVSFSFKASGLRTFDVEVRNFETADGRNFHLVVTSGGGPRHAIGDACRRFGLTERETEIARQIASGKCNASLSHELGISLRTGENHLRSIYRKVGVSSRTQLVSRLLHIQ
jgi:DNA-binding CsgD family transcriptional regulator